MSWNIDKRSDTWQGLLDSGVDIGLLQEAQPPPSELESRIWVDPASWDTAGRSRDQRWRAVVAKFSDRVQVRPHPLASITDASPDEQLAVSRQGTLAVVDVTLLTGETVTVASMYGAWEKPLKSAGGSWIYANAWVHHLISDLSALIGRQRGHKIIAAGDFNVLYGYGEYGSQYWKARYDTVFSRMEAIRLPLVGPHAPDGGKPPNPWPSELPRSSTTVPTFRTKVSRPETASRQLDFVLASGSLKHRLRVCALNSPEKWGPSDHCRILIELRV